MLRSGVSNENKHLRHTNLALLLGPEGPELTCEECFEAVDRYAELELDGADADGAVPGMRAHLEGCPACKEEHRSLRALVESHGSAPPPDFGP
jgi:hypothetical protein